LVSHVKEEHRLRVSENRVLRRMSGPKRDEVTRKWRKFHSKELHNMYTSLNIIRQIKPRRMRWAGHVARVGEEKSWWESLKVRDHLEDRGVDGRMGSKWTLGRLVGAMWSGFTWIRIETVGGLL
jgi:hypothetical protein